MNREFSITDSGNCLLEGHLLHPDEDPLGAAYAEMGRLLDGGGPDDLLVLAGSGLGWHAKAALQKIQGPEICLFEPDPLRLALMKCLGPDLNGVKIAPDEDSLLQILANQVIYGGKDKVAVFSPEAYKKAAPQVAASARRLVDEALARRQTDQTTRVLRHGQWLENLAANFRHVLKYPDLSLLAGVLPKTPAVILGAGPSLDESLPLLKGISQRALVLAAASALGPLGRVGGRAHAAVAIEAKDESRQFVGAAGENMLLAAALSSNPDHFEKWPGRLGFFHLQPWAAGLIGLGQALPTGGHATSAAFSLAVLWGCDPIILVGQDLAYSQGRIHASGRPGGEDEKRPEIIQIPAIDGGMVETSPVMQSYVAWYQEAAAHLKGLPQRPRIINATVQGAMLPGFEHMSLAEAIQDLPEKKVEFDAVLEALPRLPRPGASYLAQRLAKARLEIKSALARLADGGHPAAKGDGRDSDLVRAVLHDISPGAGRVETGKAFEQMLEALKTMGEGMYA